MKGDLLFRWEPSNPFTSNPQPSQPASETGVMLWVLYSSEAVRTLSKIPYSFITFVCSSFYTPAQSSTVKWTRGLRPVSSLLWLFLQTLYQVMNKLTGVRWRGRPSWSLRGGGSLSSITPEERRRSGPTSCAGGWWQAGGGISQGGPRFSINSPRHSSPHLCDLCRAGTVSQPASF